MKIVRTTYLSLGSNQGNKLDNLQKAIDLIGEKVGAIHKVSSIYKTKSWGFDGDAFFNCCLEASTNLNPETLLKTLLEIEESLGRVRTNSNEYLGRSIDLDILLFDDEIIFSAS